MDFHDRIVVNASIMFGKPVIKGTRITIESILNELAAGHSMHEVLQAHPNLTDKDILAALQYASSIMKNEKIYTATS